MCPKKVTDDINKKPVAGISAAAAVTITTNSLNTSSVGLNTSPAWTARRGRANWWTCATCWPPVWLLASSGAGRCGLNTVNTGRDDEDCVVAGAAMGEAAPGPDGGGDRGPAEGS